MRPAGIVTPEAVPLELQTANVGSRFLAFVLDGLIIAALVFGLSLAAAVSGGIDSAPAAALFAGAIFFIVLGYPVVCETLWRGRSPGKAALGLRVVTTAGAPVTFRHAAIRSILGLVDFVLSGGAVAVIAAFSSRRNQRLGDMVAGTVVLRERSGAVAPRPTRFEPPAHLEAYAATLDTAAVTEHDYAAVRAYLLRAPTLPPQVAADLAVQLADALVGRVRPAPPPDTTASGFLYAVAAGYQRRLSGAGVAGTPPTGPDAPAPSFRPVPADDPRPDGAERGPTPAPEGGFTPME